MCLFSNFSATLKNATGNVEQKPFSQNIIPSQTPTIGETSQ